MRLKNNVAQLDEFNLAVDYFASNREPDVLKGIGFWEFNPLDGIKWFYLSSGINSMLIDEINKQNVDSLCLNYTKGWKGENLEFLGAINKLSRLKIIDREINDIGGIRFQRGLHYLYLDVKNKKYSSDFTLLDELENVFLLA